MKRGFLKNGLRLAESSPNPTPIDAKPPPPKVLAPLGLDDGHVSDDLRKATARTVQRVHKDPSIDRAMSQGYAVLGFGITNSANLHDTLCLTYGDNRSHLRDHPGFNQYLYQTLLDTNRSMLRIMKIDGKGLGVVAKQDIPRGTIFLRERPLLTIVGNIDLQLASRLPQLLQHMDPPKNAAFRALHNCKPRGDDPTTLTGILRTNAFEVEWPFDKGEPQRAVFDWICRVNHSCSPNAGFEWDHASFCGILRSLVDIKAGEEITVTYIHLLQSADRRRAELEEKYKFDCTCPACTRPIEEQAKSDKRREQLDGRLDVSRDRFPEVAQNGFDDGYIQETLDMLDAEGLTSGRIGMLVRLAELEDRRTMFSGDRTDRGIALARRAMDALKEGGYDAKSNEAWKRMDKIMNKKAKAKKTGQSNETGSTAPEHFERMIKETHRVSHEIRTRHHEMSDGEKQSMIEKARKALASMLEGEDGARVFNTL